MAEELKSIENFKPESSERNIERLDELTKNDLQLKKERSGELKRRRGIKKQRAESRKSSDFNSANLTREFGAIQNSNFKEEESESEEEVVIVKKKKSNKNGGGSSAPPSSPVVYHQPQPEPQKPKYNMIIC